MEASITVSVKGGRPSIAGPLADRDLCLKLLTEGLRLVLTMPRPGAADGPAPGIAVPDAATAAALLDARPGR